MYNRLQNFKEIESESAFLWGARQTGKSTLLKQLYPDALYFDLLKSDVFQRLAMNPAQLREIIQADQARRLVIIDEVQKIPALLNEVHWLIANMGVRFILSGSSPRKIIRSGENLLGGRALRYELYPLVYKEIPDFDLIRALNHGLLPRHYLSKNPKRLQAAYVGNYLQDEIIAEARIRNITAFAHFLELAAFSNADIVNYTNIATDCGLRSPTIKEYFQILESTLIGHFVPSFQKKPKRRVIRAPKFYFFDLGIANYLSKNHSVLMGSEAFGRSFEHFIYLELYAYSHYSVKEFPISYWRTASQIEIDFVLGDHEVAIEVKATNNVNNRHLKGLKAFMEEYKVKKAILISNDLYPRKSGAIEIMPWNYFLDKLWTGDII